MGTLKRKPVPLIPELRTDVIRWVQPGKYVRILGIPYWEEYNVNLFWEGLYTKMKCLLATWKHHTMQSITGKNMLVNSMIYGRFRYYIQAMSPPKKLMEAVSQDAQALLWDRDVVFDPDEQGTDHTARKGMGAAQYSSRKES